MVKLKRHPEVAKRAYDLGLRAPQDPWRAIVEHGVSRARKLLDESPLDAGTPQLLRKLLTLQLSVDCEFVESNTDLIQISERHSQAIPGLAHLLAELGAETEGLLLQRSRPEPGDRRFLAVIDARGDRAYRAYFTMWHELAHVLIEPDIEQLDVVRRTPSEQQIQKDPVESVVDAVAGRIAFFRPLMAPIIKSVRERAGGLSFEAIEKIKNMYDSAASFQSTALAVVKEVDSPCCFAELQLMLKPTERRRQESKQEALPGLTAPAPEPKIRIANLVQSREGGKVLRFHPNIRVPRKSVAYEVFNGRVEHAHAVEDQGWWETKSRGPLPPLPIAVEAKRFGGNVFALIQPQG